MLVCVFVKTEVGSDQFGLAGDDSLDVVIRISSLFAKYYNNLF